MAGSGLDQREILDQQEALDQETEISSKGTYFSLGVLAAVIFITYLIIYGLYMVRI